MKQHLSSASGVTSTSSSKVVLYTTLPPLSRCPMEAWQSPVLHVPNQGRILSPSLSLSHMNDLLIIFVIVLTYLL